MHYPAIYVLVVCLVFIPFALVDREHCKVPHLKAVDEVVSHGALMKLKLAEWWP